MKRLKIIFQKLCFNKILLYGFLFLLFAFLAYPLVRLLVIPYLDIHFVEYLNRILQSGSILKSIRMTFYFSSLVTLFSVVTGVFWAWFVIRTDLPFKSFLKTLISLPYALPPFIGAISWIYLANPSNGLLNQLFGSHQFNIYSLGGLVFVETSFLYTFVFLSITTALESMDASYEEAARTSGADPKQIFFKITLPLIWPSVMNSTVLVFIASIASFGVPALIGGPAGFKVLTTEIYHLQKTATMNGLQTSILLSSFLLLFSVLLIVASMIFKGPKRLTLVTGKSSRKSLIELKNLRLFILFLLFGFLTVVLILPFAGVFLSATSLIQGTLSFQNFTLRHFHRVIFETEEIWRAFSNSFTIAVGVGLLSSLIALGLGYLLTQTEIKGKRWIELFVSIPYSAPGTVIALALILAFSQNFFGLPFSIYNTLWMFLIAFTLRYLNLSFTIVTDSYRQIHIHLIEAAQTSGASMKQVFRLIWLPLLRPALMASFFLVFVPSLSELTMSLFLTGPGLETIGTLIFQMQEYSDNVGGGASVLSTLIFVLVILINLLIKKISKGKYGL